MMPKRSTKQVKIQKARDSEITAHKDVLAVEEPLEIRLSIWEKGRYFEKSLSITMRTPGDDFELAVGFLFSEGIIQSRHDVEQLSYCVGLEKEKQNYNIVSIKLRPGFHFDSERLLRHFYTTSSCGVCGKASLEALQIRGCPLLSKDHPIISQKVVNDLTEKLRGEQAVFEKTGGLHASALFDTSGNLINLREDVGRHNAVDKLIGERLLADKIPLSDYLLLVSGRASFEIVQKALMAGIPILAAVGAPSSLAVDLAGEFGMTLLGFVRQGSFNIYTGRERVQ